MPPPHRVRGGEASAVRWPVPEAGRRRPAEGVERGQRLLRLRLKLLSILVLSEWQILQRVAGLLNVTQHQLNERISINMDMLTVLRDHGIFIFMQVQDVIMVDSEILGGTPVFRGTRVPFQNLIDYLEAGDSIDLFLYDFPSVSRKQVIEVLEGAKEKLISQVA